MEKSGSHHQRRQAGKRKGEKRRRESRAIGKYDTVPSLFRSSQTAAHLEDINKLEKLTRNKRERMGEETGGVVSEGGPLVTHFPAILPLHPNV